MASQTQNVYDACRNGASGYEIIGYEEGWVENAMNALMAKNRAEETYPDSLINGKGDAFRHALWSALNCFTTCFTSFDNAKEISRLTTELYEVYSGDSGITKIMDLQNGTRGREIATQFKAIFGNYIFSYPTGTYSTSFFIKTLIPAIIAEIEKGTLWIIEDGRIVPSSSIKSESTLFLDAAMTQLGYHEEPNNDTKFGVWYGLNYEPWCAMFVSWCASVAGILETLVPKHAYTPTGAGWFKSKSKYQLNTNNYDPKEGDVVYFYSATKERIGHVGIVVAYDKSNDKLYTIEGNSSDQVILRNYSNMRNNRYVDGFGVVGGINYGTIPSGSVPGTNTPIG